MILIVKKNKIITYIYIYTSTTIKRSFFSYYANSNPNANSVIDMAPNRRQKTYKTNKQKPTITKYR